MGYRLPSVQSNTILNSPLVTTAEAVIVTSPPFTPTFDNITILILAMWVCTPGATSNAMTATLRRGTTVGSTQISVAQYPNPAGAIANQGGSLWYFDNPGAISGVQYSLSLKMSGATANTPITDVAILVFAF